VKKRSLLRSRSWDPILPRPDERRKLRRSLRLSFPEGDNRADARTPVLLNALNTWSDVVRLDRRPRHHLYAVSDDTGINNIQGEISGSPIKSRRRARAPEKKEARSMRADGGAGDEHGWWRARERPLARGGVK